MRALLPLLAAGAALLIAAPAHAEHVCDTVDTSAAEATACVRVLESDLEHACVTARVDPAQSTDDVVSALVCVLDLGNGPQPWTCFAVGRRYFLCGR